MCMDRLYGIDLINRSARQRDLIHFVPTLDLFNIHLIPGLLKHFNKHIFTLGKQFEAF